MCFTIYFLKMGIWRKSTHSNEILQAHNVSGLCRRSGVFVCLEDRLRAPQTTELPGKDRRLWHWKHCGVRGFVVCGVVALAKICSPTDIQGERKRKRQIMKGRRQLSQTKCSFKTACMWTDDQRGTTGGGQIVNPYWKSYENVWAQNKDFINNISHWWGTWLLLEGATGN